MGLLVAGCTSSHTTATTPPYPATLPAACTILSHADAVRILGAKVYEQNDGILPSQRRQRCTYEGGFGNATVQLLYDKRGPKAYQRLMEFAATRPGARRIDGVGDRSVWTGSDLLSVRGRWRVQVDVQTMASGARVAVPNFDKTLAVARLVLANLSSK